jgi:hypothetical protein
VFATSIKFLPSLIVAGKAEAYQRGAHMGLHFNGRLLAFPANIKKGKSEWK